MDGKLAPQTWVSANVVIDSDAVQLARELDGLPLALATAGAYLDQVSTSFADYVRLCRKSWLKLQQTSPELNSYQDRALYSTWQLSFDHIKRRNELSAKLQLWTYLDTRISGSNFCDMTTQTVQNGFFS